MEARGKNEEARKQVEPFLRGNRQQAVQDGADSRPARLVRRVSRLRLRRRRGFFRFTEPGRL